MSHFKVIPFPQGTIFFVASLILSGCSGSNNGDVVSQTNTGTTDIVVGDNTIDDNSDSDGSNASEVSANTTQVTFDITVPVYVSNQLQVKLQWGEKEISANWVVDESWLIADDFKKNTEYPLTVTFSDENGALTLGTFDTNFRTQSNSTQEYVIAADQFDTAQWDNDNDGISNLSESIAGTEPLTANIPLAAQATLELAADKTIRLSWPAAVGAEYYRVMENPDGVSGYTQIGIDLDSSVTVFSHRVALYNVVDAQYLVQACNSTGCSNSSELTALGTLNDAITYIKASNTGKEDNFGTSVSLSADGSTLAVGAPYEASNAAGVDGDQSNNSTSYTGAVYLFTRVNNAWEQQAYVKASNASGGDFFGNSVSLSADGNVLAVGARLEDTSGSGVNGRQDGELLDSGAVYIFERSNGNWAQSDFLKASNSTKNGHFGVVVSLSANGNTLAVGANTEDGGGSGVNVDQPDISVTSSGAAYVFSRSSGVWRQQAYIKASNADTRDLFGGALSLSSDGNTLAVGATGEDSMSPGINSNQSDNSGTDSGAVYVYARIGEVWQQQAFVKASTNGNALVLGGGDKFGNSVSLNANGNTLVVGATREQSSATGIDGDQSLNDLVGAGAAYVFFRSNGNWSQQAYLKASNTGQDSFGESLSLSDNGDLLAVGAMSEKSSATGVNGDQFNDSKDISGAAYIFIRSNGIWQQKAYLKASNTDRASFFGSSVSLAADGETLAVGAHNEHGSATGINGNQLDNTTERAGAVYLY